MPAIQTPKPKVLQAMGLAAFKQARKSLTSSIVPASRTTTGKPKRRRRTTLAAPTK